MEEKNNNKIVWIVGGIIFIILLFLVLYIYTKKYRKIIIYKISKILVVIGIILTIFPYNLVLSFKDPIKAYQFYNGKTKNPYSVESIRPQVVGSIC